MYTQKKNLEDFIFRQITEYASLISFPHEKGKMTVAIHLITLIRMLGLLRISGSPNIGSGLSMSCVIETKLKFVNDMIHSYLPLHVFRS
jgi:hypothetical protein